MTCSKSCGKQKSGVKLTAGYDDPVVGNKGPCRKGKVV